MFTLIFIVTATVLPTVVLGSTIKIGGLFLPSEVEEEHVFNLSAHTLNLEPITHAVTMYNSLQASHAVCELMSHGVAAIIMPHAGNTLQHINSVCDTMDVMLVGTGSDAPGYHINLHVHPDVLGKLYVELVKMWQWESFTLLYEEGSSLIRLNNLLEMFDRKGKPVIVRQLDTNDNHRPVLKSIRDSAESNIILDCTIKTLPDVLRQAQHLGLITRNHNYFITSLDLRTTDLEPYQQAGSNIIGLSMVNPQDETVGQILQLWADLELQGGHQLSLTPHDLTMNLALMSDAVTMVAHVVEQMNVEFTAVDCQAENGSGQASSVVNFITSYKEHMKGLTGPLQFGGDGYRTNAEVQILKLQDTGLVNYGTWNSSTGLHMGFPLVPPEEIHNNTLRGKHLLVLSVLSRPYCMLSESSQSLTGNDRYKGFAMELIEKISKTIGFTYELKMQSHYGWLDPQTKRFTGMMGEMQAGRADLAVADLAITSDRYSAVTFSMPFMSTGISILYYKPIAHQSASVLAVFKWDVWLCILLSYVVVSLLFYVLARLSPFEWMITDRKPENEFTLLNSLWFAVGSLRPLGCGIVPRSLSLRLMALVWWHFVALLVACFTAELVGLHLSSLHKSIESPFKNVFELAMQSTIKYGVVRGGSTRHFFRDSNDLTYQTMHMAMSMDRSVLTSSIAEGVDLVRTMKGGYAFLTDSLSIEYAVMCERDLMQVGGLLDYKGYGIALPPGSTHRKEIDAAILMLKETGQLQAMKIRWWIDACGTIPPELCAVEMDMDNLCYVFIMLLVISIIGFAIGIYECRKSSSKTRQPALSVRPLKLRPTETAL